MATAKKCFTLSSSHLFIYSSLFTSLILFLKVHSFVFPITTTVNLNPISRHDEVHLNSLHSTRYPIKTFLTKSNSENTIQDDDDPKVTTNSSNGNVKNVNKAPKEQPQSSDPDPKARPTFQVLDKNGSFDLTTALFCGGLAFDAYAEPPPDSSRWEKGSSGLNVAFQSAAFTNSLYKGILQIKPIKCTDLPNEDDTAEGLITGGGVDAYLMVAVVEGKWKEDVKLIEETKYNDGVLGLMGCAHVGKSSTAWSNINEKQARVNLSKNKSGAYHIPSSWGKGGQAIWELDPPFYVYVQEPSDARIVFTVMDDDIVGSDEVIGSTHRKLTDLFPIAKEKNPFEAIKKNVITKLQSDNASVDELDKKSIAKFMSEEWRGSLKLTSKPRKKDKNGQVAAAVAAGAFVAGPAGAAVGGLLGSLYEGEPRGVIDVGIKYMPIPQISRERKKYNFKGGLPGVDWGDLYDRHINEVSISNNSNPEDLHLGGNDLEICFYINHDVTGCACAVLRSLEKRMIAVSFRGTCTPVDLVTDASLIQEPWVKGESQDDPNVPKVHVGFRNSLNSISRRLKELILACVSPGENISDYDLIVTGHSLGGALATLFTADIGEYGIDAGRSLPQLEPSEPWWNSIANVFGKAPEKKSIQLKPPRPKTLKMYNFGSPRVGNKEFVEKFDSLVGKHINEAYRIVNGQDIVARLPRTFNALGLYSIGYEHCGPTVLMSIPETNNTKPLLWIEGQSTGDCPVRDGTALLSPLAKGSLLGDIISAVNEDTLKEKDYFSKLTNALQDRLETFSASDLPTIVGIDKKFVEREAKIISSVLSGEALSHHMEDQYYSCMGRACGFIALVGEDLTSISEIGNEKI